MDMASNLNINKNKKKVDQSMLLCCKMYISESRNHTAIESIERAASMDPKSVIVNRCLDREYNRVNFTLVSYVAHDHTGSPIYSPLQHTVVAMAEAAYQTINLELQSGTHPRLGVIDDILVNPLAQSSLDDAAWLAKSITREIGNKFHVFLYAAAHPTGKSLDKIRRELGYYRPNFMGKQWFGWDHPETLSNNPDYGPKQVLRSRGICMIGARPWVAFYNIPISVDIAGARRIARRVSARGGGLPTVQSLGLAHGEATTEIACMLLEPDKVGADQVQHWVEMIASQEGLHVHKGYFTDIPPEMLVQKYRKFILSQWEQ